MNRPDQINQALSATFAQIENLRFVSIPEPLWNDANEAGDIDPISWAAGITTPTTSSDGLLRVVYCPEVIAEGTSPWPSAHDFAEEPGHDVLTLERIIEIIEVIVLRHARLQFIQPELDDLDRAWAVESEMDAEHPQAIVWWRGYRTRLLGIPSA